MTHSGIKEGCLMRGIFTEGWQGEGMSGGDLGSSSSSYAFSNKGGSSYWDPVRDAEDAVL